MMDLKEIIKWFIPCFHILLVFLNKKDVRLTFVCLFLLFIFRVGSAGNVKSVDLIDTKNVDSVIYDNKIKNQSDVLGAEVQLRAFPQFPDDSVGRTFGRPFKKMMAGLIPIIFQIGAASTWAVVAALVGVKTLVVTLIILKILLIAGAAKALALVHKEVNHKLHPWYGVYGQVPNIRTKDTSSDGEWAQRLQALALAAGHKEVNDKQPYRVYGQVPNIGTKGTSSDSDWAQRLQALALAASNKEVSYKHKPYPVYGHIPNIGTKGTSSDGEWAQRMQVGALFGAKGGHGQHQAWEPPHPQKEIHLHIHNGHHETPHDEHAPVYGSWSREDGTNLMEPKHPAINPYSIVGPQTIRTPFGNYVKVESNDPPLLNPTKRK